MSSAVHDPQADRRGEPESEEADKATGPDVRRALGLSLRTSLAMQLIGSISGIELARGLGASDRGALAAAMLWSLVAGNIGALGIEQAMTYYVAKEPERAGRFIGSGLVLSAIQSAVFGLLTLALIPLVLSRKPDAIVVSALIYALYIPLNMFAVTLNAALNGLHRYQWCNWVRLFVGIGVITCQTVLLILGVMSVRALVICFVGCYLANLIFVAVLARRAWPHAIQADRETVRTLFGYGVRSHASTVPSALNQNLDQLIISIFLSASQLGHYVVAVTLTTFTALIGASVAFATLPNVAALTDEEQRVALGRRLTSGTLLVSAIVTIPLVLAAPLLIRILFGPDFASASDVARVLLVASIALSTNRALEGVLRGVGKPLEAGLAEIVALGATFAGLAVLLPVFGLLGAGLASLAAYLVAMGYMVKRTTMALPVTARQLLVPDRTAFAALSARVAALRGA